MFGGSGSKGRVNEVYVFNLDKRVLPYKFIINFLSIQTMCVYIIA